MMHRTKSTHLQVRIEWPTEDPALNILDTMKATKGIEPPVLLNAEFKLIVDEELAKCYTSTAAADDTCVFEVLYLPERSRNWLEVLDNLYWRARRQSTIFDCFIQLVAVGLMDTTALEAPLSLERNNSDHAEEILNLLLCFRFSRDDCERAESGELGLQDMDWYADLKWLAIMIVRGGTNLRDIYNKLDQTGYLGPIDERLLGTVLARHDNAFWKIENNRNESLATLVNGIIPKTDHAFGFILPHGIGITSVTDWEARYSEASNAFLKRFNQIEEAYRKEHKLGIVRHR